MNTLSTVNLGANAQSVSDIANDLGEWATILSDKYTIFNSIILQKIGNEDYWVTFSRAFTDLLVESSNFYFDVHVRILLICAELYLDSKNPEIEFLNQAAQKAVIVCNEYEKCWNDIINILDESRESEIMYGLYKNGHDIARNISGLTIVARRLQAFRQNRNTIEDIKTALFSPTIPTERNMRTKIFISYSHRDGNEAWFKSLKDMLDSPLNENNIWSDSNIPPGDNWHDEIQLTLKKTKVAVLLVTQNFILSDYIRKNELPVIFEAAKNEGLKIAWVSCARSMYEETELKNIQCVNNPESPLREMTITREREIKKIVKTIREMAGN